MKTYNELEFINISSLEELTIKKIAELIKHVTSYSDTINWDTSKVDETAIKIMDYSKLTEMG